MYIEFYLIKNNGLFKHVVDNSQGFMARVIPDSLVDVVLHLGHNQSGHKWLPEHLCSNKAVVLLERYENANSKIL